MSKDQPESEDNKRKRNFKKIVSVLNQVFQFYYASIPLLIALTVLGIIKSFQQIPGLESPLFDPGLEIGLYFVIMGSMVALGLLYNSKLEMKKLKEEIEQIKNDLYERKNKDDFEKIEKNQNKKSSSLNWKSVLRNYIKICKYQAITVIITALSVIVILLLIFWSYMWEGEFLSKWASVVTILSLVGVPIVYFSKQDKKEKERKQNETDERNRASRNLYGELRDALDAIKGKKYPKDLLDIKIDDKTMTFTNRFLNHDMYDSLIFSGKVSFLRYELQQKIQDIFKRIKHHNYYLRLISEFQDKEKDKDIPETTYRYYELLDKDERYLLAEIPTMMKELKEEFEFEPPN